MKTLLLFLMAGLGWSAEVVIPASAVRGVVLGVEAGNVVTVSYLRGKWSRRLQNPLESPEDTLWAELRLVVYSEDIFSNRKVLGRTFLVESGQRYYLRMAEPRESGVGVVYYEVTINSNEK